MKNFLTFISIVVFVFSGSFLGLLFFGLVPEEIRDGANFLSNYLTSLGRPSVLSMAKPVSSLFSNETSSNPQIIPSSNLEEAFLVPVKNASHEDVLPAVYPRRVIIEKIGVASDIQNPEVANNKVLDEALLKGVVHYPGSGSLADDSNMFLFAHSTTYKTVNNQAYKAFNKLEQLNLGDHIRVQSDDREYLYVVTLVSQVDKDDALIEFTRGSKKLTLSTCDTFGKKSDRFVVEARFVTSYLIPVL